MHDIVVLVLQASQFGVHDQCLFVCAAAGGAGGYESDEMEIEDEDGEAGCVH